MRRAATATKHPVSSGGPSVLQTGRPFSPAFTREFTAPRRRYFITTRGLSLFLVVSSIIVASLASRPLDTLDYVLAFFLSVLVVSFVWAGRSLNGVRVVLDLPPGGMEDQSVRYSVTTHNDTPLNKTLLEVVFSAPFFLEPVAIRIPRLKAREVLALPRDGVCAARGLYASFEFSLSSQDPLALFQVREVSRSVNPFTVYPRIVPVRYYVRETGVMPQQSPVPARAIEGLGDEFMGVRDYVTGDSLKKVHWLTTARVGRLMVKQFVKESAGSFHIIMDTHAHQIYGAGKNTTLELGLVAAASIASFFIQEGALGDVYFEEPEGRRISIGSGPAQLETVLQKLAKAQGDSMSALPTVVRSVFQRLEVMDNVVVVISSGLDESVVECLTSFSGLPRSIEFCYINPYGFATADQSAGLPSWDRVVQWLAYLQASRVKVYNIEREADLAELA